MVLYVKMLEGDLEGLGAILRAIRVVFLSAGVECSKLDGSIEITEENLSVVRDLLRRGVYELPVPEKKC